MSTQTEKQLATIAALFVREDSHYKSMESVDCWDVHRDARNFPGGSPVVAHPPCRAWGSLRALAKPRPDEKALALWAVEQVRRWGGVLEHPKASTLWPTADLPRPQEVDEWGGWTLPIFQQSWGHRAEKATKLYIVGCSAKNVPDMPITLGRAERIIGTSGRNSHGKRIRKGDPGFRTECSKAEREHTPPALCEWLVELARRCKVHR